jgi:hypothetical protein
VDSSQSGVSGVYSGFVVSLWGAVLFRALYMGGYDVLKREALERDSNLMKKYLVAQVSHSLPIFSFHPLHAFLRAIVGVTMISP